MRLATIFGESFLDGFTMAGFLNRLRHPGQPTRMFAPASVVAEAGWQVVSFQPESGDLGTVRISGSLKSIPRPTLRTMIDLLEKEDEDRKLSREASEGAAHGATR